MLTTSIRSTNIYNFIIKVYYWLISRRFIESNYGKYPIINVNPIGLVVFIKIVKFGNKIQKKIITFILVNVLLKINVL